MHACRASRKPRIPKRSPRARRRLPTRFASNGPGAQQGEVFSPAAAREIGLIVAEDFNARPLADQKAILVEVPVKKPPAINTDYPTTLPLATVPPSLLLK